MGAGSVAGGAASGAAAGALGGPAGMLIGAGIGAGVSIFSAKKQSSAVKAAATTQTQASNYAADQQRTSQAEALAFQRQQAENAYKNEEAARHANYDQWAARERRLGSIGASLGYGSRDIPEYVPGVAPNYGPTAPAPGSIGASLAPRIRNPYLIPPEASAPPGPPPPNMSAPPLEERYTLPYVPARRGTPGSVGSYLGGR